MTRVLVIDDEATVRDNLAAYLEDEGFEVAGAASGEEGLERLAEEGVDVVIVDLRMGGMTGEEFILRAHPDYPTLRFLIFTGSVEYQPPAALAAAGVGPGQVFFKPVRDMALLVEAVDRLVRE